MISWTAATRIWSFGWAIQLVKRICGSEPRGGLWDGVQRRRVEEVRPSANHGVG
jgi:hypothetical protein